MFRLHAWDTQAHALMESTDYMSLVPLEFITKWHDSRYHIYMERFTVHSNHRWSYWLRPAHEWREYAEDQVPKMVRMAAMLLG